MGSITTNHLGLANIILKDGNYVWDINHGGYQSNSGFFNVDGEDKTIPIILEALAPHVPSEAKLVPYELPDVNDEDDYTNKVYIDPDYDNGNGSPNGTQSRPYTDFNNQYGSGIPSDTAFLFKRGTSHPRIGKPEANVLTIYQNMIYNNNMIGAYGTGARPIIRGLWIHPPSQHLTIRDVSIRSKSYSPMQHDGVLTIWSHGSNPEYEGTTQSSSHITVAFCEVWGVEEPTYTYRQPYDDYEHAPFRYPMGLIRGEGSNITVFYNHIKNSWTSAVGWRYAGSNKIITRNLCQNLSMCGPFNEDIWQEYFRDAVPQPNQGNGFAFSRGVGSNIKIFGNIIDRSNNFGKTVMVWMHFHKGWNSGHTGCEMKWNTLHGPDSGSTSPVFHFSPPQGTEIEWNVFDSSGKGQWSAGKVPFWGTWDNDPAERAWCDQQFGQSPPKIKNNYIVRNGHLFGSADSGCDGVVLNDNTRYTTYGEFLTAKAAAAEQWGSDIDPDDFWEPITDGDKTYYPLGGTVGPPSIPDDEPTYYVSFQEGNDSNSGTSADTPWKTLNKVNSHSFNSNDIIGFKRGDSWYGSIITSNSDIIYGAYGSGDKPIISGFKEITGWVNEGGGLYSKIDSSLQSTIETLTIEGEVYVKGRYPRAGDSSGNFHNGWHNITSASGNTSITSPLHSSTMNVSGARICCNKNDWIIESGTVSSHSGNTITYSGTSSAAQSPSKGFYLFNHALFLTNFGDWMYNGSTKKLTVYFGSENPSNYVVKVTSINDVVQVNTQATYRNLHIEGANRYGFALKNSTASNTVIEGCDINYTGWDSIHMLRSGDEGASGTPNNIDVLSCNFEEVGRWGVRTRNSSNVRVNHCVFKEVQMDASKAPSQSSIGRAIAFTDRYAGNNFEAKYNKFYNCGYSAIVYQGSNIDIMYNEIYGFGLIASDVAAIQTGFRNHSPSGSPDYVNRTVKYNLIDNTSWVNPTFHPTPNPIVNGIYCDERSCNIDIQYNIMIGCIYGLYSNSGWNISFKNNIIYKAAHIGMFIQEYHSDIIISGWDIQNNIIYDWGFAALRINNIKLQNINNYGVINNNYYINPTKDETVSVRGVHWSEVTNYTLSGWRAEYNHDQNTEGSPTESTVSELYYNYTYSPLDINIGSGKIDKDGNALNNEQTLSPFEYLLVLQ